MSKLTPDPSRFKNRHSIIHKLAVNTVENLEEEDLEEIAYQMICKDMEESTDAELLKIAEIMNVDIKHFIQQDH